MPFLHEENKPEKVILNNCYFEQLLPHLILYYLVFNPLNESDNREAEEERKEGNDACKYFYTLTKLIASPSFGYHSFAADIFVFVGEQTNEGEQNQRLIPFSISFNRLYFSFLCNPD